MPEKDEKDGEKIPFAPFAHLFPEPTVYSAGRLQPVRHQRFLTQEEFDQLPLTDEDKRKAQARVAEIFEQQAQGSSVSLTFATERIVHPDYVSNPIADQFLVRVVAVHCLDGEETPEENPLTLPVQVENQ